MGYSHKQHQGAQLPVTLFIDEVTVSRPCPMCARAELEGDVTIKVDETRMSGTTTARCPRGHMVMIAWTRENTPAPPSPDA